MRLFLPLFLSVCKCLQVIFMRPFDFIGLYYFKPFNSNLQALKIITFFCCGHRINLVKADHQRSLLGKYILGRRKQENVFGATPREFEAYRQPLRQRYIRPSLGLSRIQSSAYTYNRNLEYGSLRTQDFLRAVRC